jgi:phytoene synthase
MSSPPQRPSVTAEDELAAAIGADRALMLRQVPRDLRQAIEALWQVDAAMGDVVARSTQPALGAVKLAWWRERLEELDGGAVPAEPRLMAAAEQLLPRGLSGAELSRLEDGWATLCEEKVDTARVANRGARLFRWCSSLLGGDDAAIGDAGALYALTSTGRRGVPELLEPARERAKALSRHRFPRELRSLTGLARLAARDLKHGQPFEPEGSPPRLAALLRHQWSGRVL